MDQGSDLGSLRSLSRVQRSTVIAVAGEGGRRSAIGGEGGRRSALLAVIHY